MLTLPGYEVWDQDPNVRYGKFKTNPTSDNSPTSTPKFN
jgi:hypothetical protein